jgi:hypothetical protein
VPSLYLHPPRVSGNLLPLRGSIGLRVGVGKHRRLPEICFDFQVVQPCIIRGENSSYTESFKLFSRTLRCLAIFAPNDQRSGRSLTLHSGRSLTLGRRRYGSRAARTRVSFVSASTSFTPAPHANLQSKSDFKFFLSFRTVLFSPRRSRPLAMAHTPDLDSLRTTSIVNPSSSREHDTVPSCEFEACGLLSLDQLHHPSPVQDQDATTIVEHEDEREPYVPPISSTPNSIREASDVEPTPPCRTIHWKTVGMIIGFLFAG